VLQVAPERSSITSQQVALKLAARISRMLFLICDLNQDFLELGIDDQQALKQAVLFARCKSVECLVFNQQFEGQEVKEETTVFRCYLDTTGRRMVQGRFF